jgi:hypothetical protein
VTTPRDKLERLCKWRTVFAGWQLGTRPKGDPEADAVRDHREVTILLRAEVTALTGLLIRKGIFTAEEFGAAIGDEAELLNADYERRFPGITTSALGVHLNAPVMQEHGTMKGWRP